VDSWNTLSGRTDTIMVVTVDAEHQTALLTSLPRDVLVNLEGHGQQRINAAYVLGGPELARRSVERLLGVPIPYYAVINFSGFERVIDALGGVTITVPQDIYDPLYPAPDGIHYEPFSLPAGTHHMDGATALKYARMRMADPAGDFGRARRQQQLLQALKQQALTPRTLLRIPTLYQEFRNRVDTNLPLSAVLNLARIALTIDGNAVHAQVIDPQSKLVSASSLDGMYVLVPDVPAIQTFMRESIALLAEGPSRLQEAKARSKAS